jgi:hypothetical protein
MRTANARESTQVRTANNANSKRSTADERRYTQMRWDRLDQLSGFPQFLAERTLLEISNGPVDTELVEAHSICVNPRSSAVRLLCVVASLREI